MEEEEDFLRVLRALRDAARRVEAAAGGDDGPALHALLALDASADDLLAGDPDLGTLRRLLARIGALSWSIRFAGDGGGGGGVIGCLRGRWRRCEARRGIARAAGGVAGEIQAWIDRENVARLDVFVGPVLMGRAVGALVASASASPEPLRALNGLVAAIRSPLVDELHARGELPRLVSLLCSADPRIRALALEFALRVGYYARKEIVDALLAEGLVKRLLCLQRSDSETFDSYFSPQEKPDHGIIRGVIFFAGILGCQREDDDADDGGGGGAATSSARPFVSAVARFAVQVEVGEGLSQREKRAAKLEILRRVREAAVSPAEEATVLADVLWGATP
uniref:Uncharacterized protein n=1 Tax=Oryza glumipatula TaxID=40148 RepID=A0A0D9YZS4_9ORYZ